MANGPVQIIEDPRYSDPGGHRGPDGHPERPERLIALAEALDRYRPSEPPNSNGPPEVSLPSDSDAVPAAKPTVRATSGSSDERVQFRAPHSAAPEEILRVHEERMMQLLAATRDQEPGRIDADTYFTGRSFEIACLAAGGTTDLARAVMRGEACSGLAAVRPPGHHAEADRSMGFCLFNNVAIAARAIQAEFGSPRILILDWDVHHGNGTQHVFEDDPSVFYLSTHQFPFYPGTGDFGEAGTGRGIGATLNVPMPAGCGDAEYIGVMERLIVPAAIHFRPDVILVSCGFDAHRDDPLASMDLSLTGYQALARRMRLLAEEFCGGRIVHVLEGGYALSGVREGTRAVMESLASEEPLDVPARRDDDLQPGSMLRSLVDRVVAVHRGRIPGLGADSNL